MNLNFGSEYKDFTTEVKEFCKKYSAVDSEMKPTEKTKSMWYPKLEITKNSLLRWIEE